MSTLKAFFVVPILVSVYYAIYRSNHPNPNVAQCLALSISLGRHKVFYPGTQGYSNCVDTFFSGFETDLSPACVVQPTSTRDISKTLKVSRWLRSFGIGDPNFAIKGGGHTTFAGSANIADGITIDMAALNAVHVSDNHQVTSVGAGALWGKVYDTLVPEGLAVAGGRVSVVGVGGLTLGGGISFFSSQRGFVCDNVINYEVVLASGEIVQANAHDNADLWFALKGGSNNFGIVSRFDFRTFQQGPTWGGLRVYDPSTTPQHLDAVYNLAVTDTPDDQVHVITSIGFSQGMYGAVEEMYNLRGQPDPESLKNFLSIPKELYSEVRVANLSSHTAPHQASPYRNGIRHRFMTSTIKADRELIADALNLWNSSLSTIKDAPGLGYTLTLQPLPNIMLDRSAALGGNTLGLTRNESLLLILYVAQWTDPADDDKVIEAQQQAVREIQEAADQRGLGSSFVYMNYASEDQDPIGGYGQKSAARLKAIARKYDPDGFFQERVPGGFKLSKAMPDFVAV